METQKHPRRPIAPLTPASKSGGNEADLLFADELEIQCAARRSARPQTNTDDHRLGSKGPSHAARDLADQPIELIPILPIDEENARRFPVEPALLSPPPRQVVAVNPEPVHRSALPDRMDVFRAAPVIARPRRRFRLAHAGAIAVIAGFAIGWLAGRPLSQAVSSTRSDSVFRADTVLPAPVAAGTLGTSGSLRADEKMAAPPQPAVRPDADLGKATVARTPSVPLSDAVPRSARLDTRPPAPAPGRVPVREIPAPPASRELAAEKPAPPPAGPTPAPAVATPAPAAVPPPVAVAAPPSAVAIAETPVVTSTPSAASTASREPASPRSAPSTEAVNETAAVRAALAKYANAYSELDAAAVAAVWPSVDGAGLRRAFGALDAQQVTFDRCDVQVSGAAGRATCVGSAMWRPKIGGGNAREQNRTWTFVLKNAGGSWQIVKSDAR